MARIWQERIFASFTEKITWIQFGRFEGLPDGSFSILYELGIDGFFICHDAANGGIGNARCSDSRVFH
ncbi:hypothetical protein GCM10020331_023690 [Ectobacillus funiculus]